MNLSPSDQELLGNIFFPRYNKAREELAKRSSRFAYYTDADTLLKILNTQEIWMRSTKVMNDYQEVEHGLKLLARTFDSPVGKRLATQLNSSQDNLWDELASFLHQRGEALKYEVFVTCFSEHRTEEDSYGRLSMWRAYGRSSGVALIVNTKPFFQTSTALGAYTSPVAYEDDVNGSKFLEEIAYNLSKHKVLIQRTDKESLFNTALAALAFASVSIKHPAFQEENEWRVIAFENNIQTSEHLLTPALETIAGVPQKVLKIPLKYFPEKKLDLALSTVIEEILVGPCAHPEVIKLALIEQLEVLGFENPADMIKITRIPLRF